MSAFIPVHFSIAPRRTLPSPTRSKRQPQAPRCAADRSAEFYIDSNDSNSDVSRNFPSLTQWDEWPSTDEQRTLPCLPFPPLQICLPGETRQLHLYEARYLALLEATVDLHSRRCAHILVDVQRRAMAAVGALLIVRKWTRLEVGVHIVVDAVARIHTNRLHPHNPFLSVDCVPINDNPVVSSTEIALLVSLQHQFWPAFRSVIRIANALGIDPRREKIDPSASTIAAVQRASQNVRRRRSRLFPQARLSQDSSPASDFPSDQLDSDNSNPTLFDEDDLLVTADQFEAYLKQTALRAVGFQTLDWPQNHRLADLVEHQNNDIVVRRALALSFAAWDFFPSHPDKRQKAMEERNTAARLQIVVTALEQYSKQLAAELALKSALSSWPVSITLHLFVANPPVENPFAYLVTHLNHHV